MLAKSPSAVGTRTVAYDGFMGLDTSRDLRAQDTGQEQHLAEVINAHCDWRGQIVKDAAASFRNGEMRVRHINFFATGAAAWVEESEGALTLKSDNDHTRETAWPKDAIPTSFVFNRRLQFLAGGQSPYNYDGVIWREAPSPAVQKLKPAFGATVQRRMAVAGIIGRETEVHISRVDNDTIFPDDETAGSENVLRAGLINVANLLGTADKITGLSSFEQDRLVIFTQDRALIYFIDPDLTRWQIDSSANIQIGCISHNTIVRAGTDVLFCSRSGVHSIKRSVENGITVFSLSMSDKVELLYRRLIRLVPDTRLISAVFDQDEARYHIFFPIGDNTVRLSLSMNPEEGGVAKWSSGDFLNATCGAFLAGEFLLGTPGGIYTVGKIESESGVQPTVRVKTPILWLGSMTETKDSYSLMIQAGGQGKMTIEATDDEGRKLGVQTFDIEDGPDDGSFFDVPLSRQFERPFQYRFRGVQLTFTVEGTGVFRLNGFAIVVRK